MDINAAVVAIEKFLETYKDARANQVRPSGDDVDVIKIWIETSAADPKAYAKSCEDAIRKAIPGASAFRLQIRAESLDTKPIKKP